MPPSMIPIPFMGRIHFAWHLKGVFSMGFIILYWLYSTQIIMWVVLWPGYNDTKISIEFIIIYWLVAINCFLCIFKASTLHPGRVPIQTNPAESGWTYCDKCCIKRPPRAHHCSRCQHCVKRLDHHCPWINNCVGEHNHYAFVQLLSYALLLSVLSALLALLGIFVYSPCNSCDHSSYLVIHSSGLMVSVFILGIVMAVFMGSMWFVQYFNFMTDRTTLQNIISPPTEAVDWADDACPIVYEKFFGPGPVYKWFCPCHQKPHDLLIEARTDVV